MDKQEHATRLRRAMAEREVSNSALAEATGASLRTVSNWLSRTDKGTMPSDTDRVKLRRILGEYDRTGDAVEVALAQSELVAWRRNRVLSLYQQMLSEQQDTVAG